MNPKDKLKPTRNPGVFRRPDGRLLAKVSVRTPDGRVVVRKQLLDPDATEADAVRLVLTLKEQIKNPPPPPSTLTRPPPTTSTTVAVYAEGWLALRRQKLKPSTAYTYAVALGNHILPRIGWMQCVAVTRASVEAWTIWAQQKADKAGNAYSNDTMQQWWRVLKAMLMDMAAELGLPDPTVRVSPPVRPQQAFKREQRTLDADDLARLLEAAKAVASDRYPEVALLCLTGMRAGELYGLKWDCVDLERGVIVVRRSISLGKVTETTKTKSQRTVPLHPLLIEILTAHRAAWTQLSEVRQRANLVFPSDAGTPRTANSLDRSFLNIAKEMKTDLNLGAQVLRRSMNSNLLRQAVDRLTIRSIMGHTTEQMTARYYGAGDSEKMAAVLKLSVGPKLAPVAAETPAE